MALIRRSYSPAGRLSTRYLPSWLDSTLTVILVFVFWTCTKAPSKGAPSDPFKFPVIVAPGETEARETNKTKNPRVRISTHIASPHLHCIVFSSACTLTLDATAGIQLRPRRHTEETSHG